MEAQQREMQKKMEQASPEQRAAMAQDFHIMKDVGAIVKQLQPSVAGAEALNRVLTTVDVLSAMAECPSFESLTTAIKNLEPDQAKAVVRAFITLEQALLSHATAADAEALRAVKTKPEKKRPLLLLLWALYQHKIGDAVVLDDMMTRFYEGTRRLATQLLMRLQMVLPQQRLAQPTVAVARVSALLVNALWDHDDPVCVQKMREILAPPEKPEENMPFPELHLKARTVLAIALESGAAEPLTGEESEPCSCLPGQLVAVQLELTRLHAGTGTVSADVADRTLNPQGIIEAYWAYIEGHTPKGSTLLAATPLTVTSLATTTLPAVSKFEAPKEAGTYDCTVHIVSTSVVGVDITRKLSFVVQDDDVPALE